MWPVRTEYIQAQDHTQHHTYHTPHHTTHLNENCTWYRVSTSGFVVRILRCKSGSPSTFQWGHRLVGRVVGEDGVVVGEVGSVGEDGVVVGGSGKGGGWSGGG